jgi:uncharacterized DUF497 family protein
MRITFDDLKNERNITQRDLSFERASAFAFETAFIWRDDRRDYGEVRYSALGMIDDRLHALVFTETADGIRVISLRKANAREVKRYETRS